jgi:hypothetical protein
MNKSQLREIIRDIVRRKITEGKIISESKYGYIIPDADGNIDDIDPMYQLIGYGNMPKSYWKKKILKDIDTLKKYIEHDDWRAAAYLVEQKGVLHNSIHMMQEIEVEKEKVSDQEINEIDLPTKDTTATTDKGEEIDPRKQAEIDSIQKKLDAEKTTLQQVDGKIADLDATIANAKRPLELKQRITKKKIGALTDKLQTAKQG